MRALLVTEFLPYGTDFGAQQRSHLLWRALTEMGEVDVLLLGNGARTSLDASADGRLLAHATFRSLPFGIAKYSPDRRLNRLLAGRVDPAAYDVVCARYLGPVSKLALPAGVPVVVDLDDAGYEYAAGPGMLARATASCKSALRRRLERAALRRFPRYWFVCERDRNRFGELAGGVLPNIPVASRPAADCASSGSELLFVGALWYGPNRSGIERFLAACWPEIRRAVPGARLRLVGSAPRSERDRWGSVDGVSAPGFVHDLAGAYAGCAFSVAPIYSGGGTNIKVVESFAMGRACVATPHCLDGLRPHFSGETDLVVAGDDEAMTRQCIRLLREPAQREALARAGQAIVAGRYNYDVFRAAVQEQVRLAIGGPRP